jgi:hypothetical protein
MTYDPGTKKFRRLVPQLPRELVIIHTRGGGGGSQARQLLSVRFETHS